MKRKRDEGEASPQRSRQTRQRHNVMRNMVLVVDLSDGSNRADMLPTRLANIISSTAVFAERFFDECPLGRLGGVITREGTADKLCRLQVGASPFLSSLQKKVGNSCGSGQGSLQNSLEHALAELSAQPAVSTREVLVVWASNNTCDPGDIGGTLSHLKQHNIRVNVIGLGGSVRVLQHVADTTGGTYVVPRDETAFRRAFLRSAAAPVVPEHAGQAPGFVTMAFPTPAPEGVYAQAAPGGAAALTGACYECPVCATPTPSLPSLCGTCGITLLSSAHVARSYYSLHPLPPFVQLTRDQLSSAVSCDGCNTSLSDSVGAYTSPTLPTDEASGALAFRCPSCSCALCPVCHDYAFDKLHRCPCC